MEASATRQSSSPPEIPIRSVRLGKRVRLQLECRRPNGSEHVRRALFLFGQRRELNCTFVESQAEPTSSREFLRPLAIFFHRILSSRSVAPAQHGAEPPRPRRPPAPKALASILPRQLPAPPVRPFVPLRARRTSPTRLHHLAAGANPRHGGRARVPTAPSRAVRAHQAPMARNCQYRGRVDTPGASRLGCSPSA